jgi:hypothetical protein
MNMLRCVYGLCVCGLSIASVFLSCSVGPNEPHAGTETGNPDAAIAVAFSGMQAESSWCVARYIPGGSRKLDPGDMVLNKFDNQVQRGFAKTAATPVDAAVDTIFIRDTLYSRDTVVFRDTTVECDTSVARDTLTRTVTDTTDSMVNNDTATWITRNSVPYYVTDTTVTCDTSFFTKTYYRTDTIVINDTLLRVAWDGDSGIAKNVDTVQLSPANYERLTGNFIVAQDLFYMSTDSVTSLPLYGVSGRELDKGTYNDISRTYTNAAGEYVNESYSDADGDERIFTAAPDTVPTVHYHNRLTGPAVSDTALVTFTGGDDTTFVSTGENHVLALQRRYEDADSTVAVSYAPARLRDSATLAIHTETYSGDIATVKRRYRLGGAIMYPCSSTTLLRRIEKNVDIRNCKENDDVRHVQIVYTFDPPVTLGTSPAHARLSMEITFTDGTKATLTDATIDFTAGTLSGTFSRNDTTYTGTWGYME